MHAALDVHLHIGACVYSREPFAHRALMQMVDDTPWSLSTVHEYTDTELPTFNATATARRPVALFPWLRV